MTTATMPGGVTTGTVTAGEPTTTTDLFTIVTAPWMSYLVHAAIKLGIIDALASQALSAREVALRCDLAPETTDRLLAALVRLDIVRRSPGGAFRLSSTGRPLADPDGEMRAWSSLWAEEFGAAWALVADAVRGGRTPFEVAHGVAIFQYLGGRPETARTFNRAMAGLSGRLYAAVPASFDFRRHKVVVDVGGGTGGLLRHVLSAHPHLAGILLERQSVAEEAAHELERDRLSDRCRVVAGDFFEQVPAGGDLYILANILHDWDDERAGAILRVCRRSMAPGGRLLLIEMALGPGEPELARMTDINMLVLTGGRERTRNEFERLLSGAGFRLVSIAPMAGMTCLVEAEAQQ